MDELTKISKKDELTKISKKDELTKISKKDELTHRRNGCLSIRKSLLVAGWDSSDSDTSAPASRGAWPLLNFPWWSAIAIAKRQRLLWPTAPRLRRAPPSWLPMSM